MTAHSRYDDRKSNINGPNRTFWLIEAFMENNMLVVRPSLNEQRRASGSHGCKLLGSACTPLVTHLEIILKK